jgi:hypothetical protein
MNQMLHRQLALERQQGYRGPATRLVGPIESVADANLVVRECSLALIVLGAVQVFLTMRLGWGSVGIGVVIILASVAVRVWPGLLTAAILVMLCVTVMVAQMWLLALGYLAPLVLPSLRVVFAVRAGWAVWHRRSLQVGLPVRNLVL